MERLKPLYELGIKSYEGRYPKPLKEGFLESCDRFKFDPAVTWMIGDNPNTDGGAVGVLEGMAFVAPIADNPGAMSWKKRMISPFQRLFREMAIQRTISGNNDIITSRHLKDFVPTIIINPRAGGISSWKN
jgi:predicted HAD superfamily phosphohydrolase YqeG